MTLYDRAVNVSVKLAAAAAADASDARLAQGQILVTELDQTSSRLEAATLMRATVGVDTRPGLDAKAAPQAIGAFRAGLSRHGAAAFQHAPAGTLRDVAKQQRAATERWALSTWKARLDDLTPHAALATNDRLQGNAAYRQRAETRLRKLRRVRDFNPLLDAVKLQTDLGGDALADWLKAVAHLDQELHDALETLDAARAQQSPTLRAALARASSVEGLPLDELTDELLAELRAVGVEEQLVVRRV
jgi:hypothetical protein